MLKTVVLKGHILGIWSLGHNLSLQSLAQRIKSCNVEDVRNKLTLHTYRMKVITFIIPI